MKKILLSAVSLAVLSLTSCSKDDDKNENRVEINADDFRGELLSGESATLDPDQVYNLTGSFIVRGGATLNIPAGTRIEATGGTSSFIGIAQDGKLYVTGTATNPVVMTSGNATQATGDWGGLVICGRANTNKGGSTGQTATSEVGELAYGGTNNTDNSGSIRYLRVEYTGAAFNASKEFNGVSLFGVGSGTTFEYVQAYQSGDDGIEFFGGTVNGRYLIALHSEDDAIDFADGYAGTLENVFIKDVAKAGVEGSNNGDNGDATPRTNATLKKFTILKGNLAGSEGGMFLKEGSGSWTCQDIYIDGFTTGLKINSATADEFSNSNVDDGNITFNPIYFGSTITTLSDYTGVNDEYITEGTNTGAGSSASTPTWATGWTAGF